MGDCGIDNTTAGSIIQMAILGQTTKNQYNASDNDYNIRVQLNKQDRISINDVKNLRINTKNGTFVRLGDIAEIKLSSGPTQVDRVDRER